MRRVSLHGFKSFTFENPLTSKLHVVYEELQNHPALDLNGFGFETNFAIAFCFINFSVLSFIIALIHFDASLTEFINNQIETGYFVVEQNKRKHIKMLFKQPQNSNWYQTQQWTIIISSFRRKIILKFQFSFNIWHWHHYRYTSNYKSSKNIYTQKQNKTNKMERARLAPNNKRKQTHHHTLHQPVALALNVKSYSFAFDIPIQCTIIFVSRSIFDSLLLFSWKIGVWFLQDLRVYFVRYCSTVGWEMVEWMNRSLNVSFFSRKI